MARARGSLGLALLSYFVFCCSELVLCYYQTTYFDWIRIEMPDLTVYTYPNCFRSDTHCRSKPHYLARKIALLGSGKTLECIHASSVWLHCSESYFALQLINFHLHSVSDCSHTFFLHEATLLFQSALVSLLPSHLQQQTLLRPLDYLCFFKYLWINS